jgi:hypothetical protein
MTENVNKFVLLASIYWIETDEMEKKTVMCRSYSKSIFTLIIRSIFTFLFHSFFLFYSKMLRKIWHHYAIQVKSSLSTPVFITSMTIIINIQLYRNFFLFFEKNERTMPDIKKTTHGIKVNSETNRHFVNLKFLYTFCERWDKSFDDEVHM